MDFPTLEGRTRTISEQAIDDTISSTSEAGYVTTRPRLKEDAKSTKPKQLVVSENINNSGDYNYIQKGEKISIQVEEGDAKPNNIIVNTPNRTLNAYEILNAEAAETLRGQTMGSEITDFIYAANGVAKLLGIEPIEIIGQKSKQISEAYHKAKADGRNFKIPIICYIIIVSIKLMLHINCIVYFIFNYN